MAFPSPVPYIESTPKHVRTVFEGEFIIDTYKAKLVWEKPAYPLYFFHEDELPVKFLKTPDNSDPQKTIYDLVVGSRSAPRAVTHYPRGANDLGGLFTITFAAVDHWFEEEEEIFVHPKDPYKRVDVLQSSKHIRIEIDGVEVANTRLPRLLFETSLRVRTYIPKTHCRLDLLEPSETRTRCPYKGEAQYYHVKLPSGEKRHDIVWWYESPLPECGAIKGYVAFYDEKVDVWVNGERQARG